MATKQLEKDIQDAIIQWLGYQPNTFVWRQNAGMRVSEYKGTRHVFRAASVAGISDIIGVWNGKPLAIEVKRPGGKPTESQLQFLHDFAKAGGIAMVATSLEEVQNILNQIENGGIPPTIEGQLKTQETNAQQLAQKKGDRQ